MRIQIGEQEIQLSGDRRSPTGNVDRDLQQYRSKSTAPDRPLIGTFFALRAAMGNVVRVLGFTRLGCGCMVGRYREVATSRELSYVEEKGKSCGSHGHRRNHTVAADRLDPIANFDSKDA